MRLRAIILSFFIGLPAFAQVIAGPGGERTEALFDDGAPLVIRHLDSLGRPISIKAYAYTPGGAHPSQVTLYRNEKDWNRISYRYHGDELVSVAVYGPKGLQNSISRDRADTTGLAFRRALRVTMPAMPDPVADWQLALEGAGLCAQDTLMWADPLDGKAFLFASDGRFLCRVQYPEGPVVLWKEDGDNHLVASFADEKADPMTVGAGTRAVRVLPDQIALAMEMCGAQDPQRHGLFKGCAFLARGSAYGGPLDFAVREEYGVNQDYFYVTSTSKEGNVAHNHFNYGNFLWGASARETGVPLWVARLGAHFNNFFLSPDSRGTLDSPDDQFSIGAGYHWR